MRSIYTLGLLLLSGFVFGQNPVSWSFDTNQVGPNEYILSFKADFPQPWVVYAMESSEDGPIPTTLTFTSDNVQVLGDPMQSGKKKEGMDDMFGVRVVKYLADQPYLIRQKVRLTDASQPIRGYVTFMTCDNSKCLPPEDVDFSFTYKTIPMEDMKKLIKNNKPE